MRSPSISDSIHESSTKGGSSGRGSELRFLTIFQSCIVSSGELLCRVMSEIPRSLSSERIDRMETLSPGPGKTVQRFNIRMKNGQVIVRPHGPVTVFADGVKTKGTLASLILDPRPESATSQCWHIFSSDRQFRVRVSERDKRRWAFVHQLFHQDATGPESTLIDTTTHALPARDLPGDGVDPVQAPHPRKITGELTPCKCSTHQVRVLHQKKGPRSGP